MTQKQPKKEITRRTYWLVFTMGVIFIMLMGLFTYLFNNPI